MIIISMVNKTTFDIRWDLYKEIEELINAQQDKDPILVARSILNKGSSVYGETSSQNTKNNADKARNHVNSFVSKVSKDWGISPRIVNFDKRRGDVIKSECDEYFIQVQIMK